MYARLLILLVVVLTGCGAPHALNATATPTSTPARPTSTPVPQPTLLTVQTVSLPSYAHTGGVGAVDGGFVFSAWPATTSPTASGGLYYYRYATASVTRLDLAVRDPKLHTQPSSGPTPGIQQLVTSGAIAVYAIYNDVPGSLDLRAMNVVTGERWVLATNGIYTIDFRYLASDGRYVIFSKATTSPSGIVATPRLYDLTTRTVRALPDAATGSTPTALSASWLYYYRTVGQQATMYRIPLAGGAAETVFTSMGRLFGTAFTREFAVWAEEKATGEMVVKAYDLAAKQVLFPSGFPCSHPRIVLHYVACLGGSGNVSAYDLRSNATFRYVGPDVITDLTAGQDRMIWFDAYGNTTTVRYAMLPA